jgi:hypothetical protein
LLKFIKIVPLNRGEILTPIGFLNWLMGDGYWFKSHRTVYICTDNFTLSELELLIKVLKINFILDTTIRQRNKGNGELCWRIRFSLKKDNLSNLINLVKPYLISYPPLPSPIGRQPSPANWLREALARVYFTN